MNKKELQALVAQYNKENPDDKIKLVDEVKKYYVLVTVCQKTNGQERFVGGTGYTANYSKQEYKTFFTFATPEDADLFIISKEYKEYGGHGAKRVDAKQLIKLGFNPDVAYYRYFDIAQNDWLHKKFA